MKKKYRKFSNIKNKEKGGKELQISNNPIGKNINMHFTAEENTCDQWTYRQMLNITRIQENSNQENNEMLFYT